MQMHAEGAQKWKLMTGENVGKQIAIVLDGYVVSAPNVMGEIPGGRSSISMGGAGDRNKQLEDATDLANVLKAGALPAPARIIDETVVGPSLGAENISRGMWSFLLSLIMVMVFMVVVVATRITGVPGVDFVGPIPEQLQTKIGFAAGLSASAKQPDAAKALIRFLTAPAAAVTLKANGVEPI